jgi:hypothetical protein
MSSIRFWMWLRASPKLILRRAEGVRKWWYAWECAWFQNLS